jgi:cell wall-associated NlpC family hydrolase
VTGRAATGGPVRGRTRVSALGRSTTGWAPIVPVLAVVAAALLLAVGPASAQTVTSKREQAQAILAEVQQLDANLEQTVEAWHYANIELARIDADLASNARNLVAAKKSLGVAQTRIAKRLRDLYVNGSGDSTLEVLLGARSLDDIITRLDAIERVSHQDAKVLTAVKKYRREVETRRANLQKARADQASIVAQRASERSSIESRLAEREQMLSSVRDEIARLQAEEQARQAQLAAEARARARAQEMASQQIATESYAESLTANSYTPNVPAARYSQVVSIALQYLGIPYVWGGASPSSGFDCSGLVQYVFAQVGVYLPHHAASQFAYGTPVSREQLEPGDLVFFNGLGHVGIYIGSGQFVHAPHTGDIVKISSLDEAWYAATFMGGRRL